MKRDSFVFYESFYSIIKKLPSNDDVAEFVKALCEYSLYKNEVETSLICTIAMEGAKPNIDAATRRYIASVENGKKGGRPPKNKNLTEPSDNLTEPSENLGETRLETRNLNDNVDDNVNDNENVDVNDNEDENANADSLSNSICNDTSTDSDIMQEIEKYFGNKN